MNITAEFKRFKEGIISGSIFGVGIVFYMKSQGIISNAMVSAGGLIEKLIPPTYDLAFVKLLIAGILFGGFIGYTMQKVFLK